MPDPQNIQCGGVLHVLELSQLRSLLKCLVREGHVDLQCRSECEVLVGAKVAWIVGDKWVRL